MVRRCLKKFLFCAGKQKKTANYKIDENQIGFHHAGMAELADALDSGSSEG